jgi:hypothetical protein
MKITPIRETGSSRTGTLKADYKTIVEQVGEPNVTDMDDEDKVKASWGFKDEDTKKEGFIWCYHFYGNPENCDSWSTDGDETLLFRLFGEKFKAE